MLSVKGLAKTYVSDAGKVAAVQALSLEIPPGAFYTLLGPSGCGKSTTLRCVAGLEEPDEGQIAIGAQVVYSSSAAIQVASRRRGIGMVFQSYAVWPHMTVFDNVAFPLTYGDRRLSRQEIREHVLGALDLVQLTGMESRPAPLLSGGQQQRVALARALVYEPKLLLLDEPLSNLDAQLRAEMRSELKELVRRLGITTLYVTHDQLEALSMSDRIGVMHQGRLVQEGSPKEIYRSPRNLFTATFVGKTNLLEGHVTRPTEGKSPAVAETPIGVLRCHLPVEFKVGDQVTIGVRPEVIEVYRDRPDLDGNLLEAIVEEAGFVGDAWECEMRCGSHRLHVKAAPSLELDLKAKVYLHIPPAYCVPIRLA